MIQSAMVDPAAGTHAPPNYGREVLGHVHTINGRFGIASHAYLNMDEALRDSATNADRMRTDCAIMECVEARQRAVALLPWHIEGEDDKDPRTQELVSEVSAILQETPRFTELRRSLLDAVWYGRAGIANQFATTPVRGKWRTVVGRWEPRHGDKLVFRFDSGDRMVDPNQIGIRVSAAFRRDWGRRNGFGQQKIMATEMGLVYWLDQWERQTMCVHKHMVEDAPFHDPRSAGRIHGIGIRDRIYWTWYAMVECLQRVIEYLDRAAFGVEVWPYQAGNNVQKQRTEEAAKMAMSGGRTVILAPIPQGEDAQLYMPQLIEPGLGGVSQTMEIIRTFFGHKIKRYILGQTLSSEADATGLGSGVADAHLATFADILAYDARNLEETLTTDLLRVLQHWNFRGTAAQHCKLQFRIDTESDNVQERLQALKSSWEMGLRLKADEVYKLLGTAKPDAEDEVLENPQIAAASQAAANDGVMPHPSGGGVLDPEAFAKSFMQNMAQGRAA